MVVLLLLNFVECLLEVIQNVVDVLGADAQTNGRGRDVLLCQLLRTHLRVGGGVGVDDEALHVGNVGKEREDLKRVDKLPCCLLASFYLEGEDASAAVGEIFLVEGMVGM